jgi:osmotically-inducible protein OsmY
MTAELHSNPKDAELEAVIISRIRQMGEHMHAQLKDGVVHLSGTVNEFETKREIMTLVQGIGGVHEVSNNIRVARVSDGTFENYS